jgi:hypothetical protein
MNFKFAIAASAMMTFAGIFTLVGCGGDACTQAADHSTSCGVAAATTSGSTSATTQECTGLPLCSSTCINAAPCDQVKDLSSGMPTATSKPLLDCLTKCSATK